MAVSNFIRVLLFFTCFIYINANLEDTLQLVHVIFRHGDRNPTETYNNDPYKNYSWADGWGALTKEGKRQLFELGTTLRERYTLFFIKDGPPSSNILYVQTSDADRCHMSGLTFLAGLFPPNKDQIWNKNLNWQPIALHSLPRNLDTNIAMKKKCKTYDKALADAYNSQEIQNINHENEEMYKYLAKYTGQDMSNITAVEFLYNTLEIEESRGLKLPFWTQDIYPEKLKKIATRSLEIFTETEFMGRMKGGVWLKEVLNNIIKKQKNKLPERKMFVYSGHDISLINILHPMKLFKNLKPEYGAAFIIEAHSAKTDDYEIKMLYYPSYASKDPKVVNLENCPEPCYLKKFIQLTKPLIPDDWEKECENL